MGNVITFIILLAIAAAAFGMSLRSFREKGFLFNNAYLYASKQEREAMDKKPYYRQSSVVFALLGMIFLLNALSVLFSLDWMIYLVGALIVLTLVYAIVSGIVIEKNRGEKR